MYPKTDAGSSPALFSAWDEYSLTTYYQTDDDTTGKV